ncbi:MAG: CAP domain-containing protein [Ferruginibacter sp.]
MRLKRMYKPCSLFFILPVIFAMLSYTIQDTNDSYVSPLSTFSSEWDDSKYEFCNTASGTDYLAEEEKNLIHILNLARTNPSLFANTVIIKYINTPDKLYLQNNSNLKSLLAMMKTMKPIGILKPDEKCFTSAQCHAKSSGTIGYVGHDRKNNSCKQNSYFFGECCDYGHDKALGIVITLLIDENVASLGHRKIFLDPAYKSLGVSIQPHKTFRFNAVMDFAY